jgi:asparagine synthase (glutamine-hydrolysing)
VLGHARLSIIDLEGGWQPIFNEDGRLAITFNGEIYNYLELRKDLEACGHRFRTRSDTEVIVHAYEEWGEDCPKRFNGQFAFAIFDSVRESLFLCRDRLGVRPLFHAQHGEVFIFASEAKAIFASGLADPELSVEGMHQIFTFWSNPFPFTPFEGVSELPPAHVMSISTKGITVARYWELPVDSETLLTPDECLEGVLHHLNRSIKFRLRADVPVAAYLSGGLDSALTTTLIRRWTDTPLKTFSLEFVDPRFDESAYQREMVHFLGTDHSSFRCGPADIVDHFEDAIWASERPLLRAAPIPMLLLSRLVRSEGYKVVITGEGADEFFLGYDIYKEAKVREFCSRMPDSKIRPALLRRLYPYLFKDPRTARFQQAFFLRHYSETSDPFYGHRIRWEQSGRISDFYSEDVRACIRGGMEAYLEKNLPAGFSSLPILQRTQIVEVETLLSGYILSSQGDRVGMANSVEGRFPFLDHELIEFVNRIPLRMRMPGLQEKALLKRIGTPILPASIVERKKFPYRAPDVDSFLAIPEGRERLESIVSDGSGTGFRFFDQRKVLGLIRKVLAEPRRAVTTTDNLVLMAVLSAHAFEKRFLRSGIVSRSFSPADNIRRAHHGEKICHRTT